MVFATSFILYFWFGLGLFLLLKSETVVSSLHLRHQPVFLVSGSDGFAACNALVDLVGFLFICLSLMTCPNPHGYWMASMTLLAGAAKLHYQDGLQVWALGEGMGKKGQLIVLALLILPFATSSWAVLTHKKKQENGKTRRTPPPPMTVKERIERRVGKQLGKQFGKQIASSLRERKEA